MPGLVKLAEVAEVCRPESKCHRTKACTRHAHATELITYQNAQMLVVPEGGFPCLPGSFLCLHGAQLQGQVLQAAADPEQPAQPLRPSMPLPTNGPVKSMSEASPGLSILSSVPPCCWSPVLVSLTAVELRCVCRRLLHALLPPSL